MEVVGITAEDVTKDDAVGHVHRAIRVEENATGNPGITTIVINVHRRGSSVVNVVATAEIEHHVAEAYSSSEGDPSVELDVAQPTDVDRNQVGCAAVDRQRLPAAVREGARIKYMDALTVDGEHVPALAFSVVVPLIATDVPASPKIVCDSELTKLRAFVTPATL